MGYAIVVVVALVVGAAAYALTMRQSRPPDTSSFAPRGPEMAAAEPVRASDVTYVPVGAGTPISWQTRSISLLALVALIMVGASAIGVALYQVGSILINVIIHKLQNS